jgi:short subunit dehydrogenase-like uncharacterized protein
VAHKYDIVLLGATGYTGQLTAEYLVAHSDASIAIAGRSLKKLNALKRHLSKQTEKEIGVIKVDVSDQASLNRAAKQTKVLVTTVGPFIHSGEPVVRACIQEGAHYLDITGEPEYVDHILRKYHQQAKAAGVAIINCCGFDSIPHDLGVLFALEQIAKRVDGDMEGECLRVKAYVSGSGDYSAGTWHSVVYAMSRYRKYLKQKRYWKAKEKATLKNSNRVFKTDAPVVRFHQQTQSWALPFPTIDADIIMRSAKALPQYGARFDFGHYVLFKNIPNALKSVGMVGGVFTASQFQFSRDWLLNRMQSGDGPTAQQRRNGWFKVYVDVESSQQSLKIEVAGKDPAYGETSKMLAEAALHAASANLPTGVITPSEALGVEYIARLQKAGMEFNVIHE